MGVYVRIHTHKHGSARDFQVHLFADKLVSNHPCRFAYGVIRVQLIQFPPGPSSKSSGGTNTRQTEQGLGTSIVFSFIPMLNLVLAQANRPLWYIGLLYSRNCPIGPLHCSGEGHSHQLSSITCIHATTHLATKSLALRLIQHWLVWMWLPTLLQLVIRLLCSL